MLAALLLAPMVSATGDSTIRLSGEISTASWADADALSVDRALFNDVQALAMPGEPLRIEWTSPDVPVVTQHWTNQTVVYDQLGGYLYKRAPQTESRTLALQPTVAQLEPVRDEPTLRLALQAGPAPTRFADVDNVALDGRDRTTPPEQWTIAADAEELRFDFDQAPDHAGYASFNGHQLVAGGAYGLLLEGWQVKLTDGDQVFETTTVAQTTNRVGPPTAAGTVAVTESRYYLTVTGIGDPMRFQAAWVQFSGYAAAPHVAWNGASTVHVIDGMLDVDGRQVPLQGASVDLWGRFDAFFSFDQAEEALTTHLEAIGRGMTSVDGPAPDLSPLGASVLAVPVVDLATILVSVLLGALGLFVVRKLHQGRTRDGAPKEPKPTPEPAVAPPAPAASPPAPDHPRALVERVRANPMDAEAHLLLGAQLLDEAEPDQAVRRLDRAFRLDPLCILRFLEEPRFAPARADPNVRQLLARIHQERFRKNWIGYV